MSKLASMSDAQVGRLAAGLWMVLALVMVGKSVIKPTTHSVYPMYADVGRDWWSPGTGEEHPARIAHMQARYGANFWDFMGVFCHLPDRWGGAIWSLFSLGVFLSGLWMLSEHLFPPKMGGWSRHWAYVIAPWFGVASLYNGQVNVLIAGCLAWGVAMVAQGQFWLAGLCIAVPVCFKTYPIALAMILASLYPRRFALPFIASLCWLLTVPFLWHDSEWVLSRYERWAWFLSNGFEICEIERFVGFRQFLETWVFSISGRQFALVQMVTGLGVLACIHRLRQRQASERDVLVHAYVLTMLWIILFGPATEEATFLLAAPAFTWMVIEGCRSGMDWREQWTVGACAVVAGPLQTSILGEAVRQWVWSWKLAALAVAILFVLHVAWSRRVVRATSANGTVPSDPNPFQPVYLNV